MLKGGLLVRSESFTIHQIIGNPLNEVKRFNEWNVDELIYLDITRGDHYDMRRSDHKVRIENDPIAILKAVSRTCFMPLTWGGQITSVDDMHVRFRNGADKITVNTAAVADPGLISKGARAFGSQAIVVSIDAKRDASGAATVWVDGGRADTGMGVAEWAREAERAGAGEILLQSIDRDGTGEGYDIDLIREASDSVTIPVIACSGVGRYEDYVEGIRAGASAAAAANIWHFKELSDLGGKRALAAAGIPVRL
ncbi:MAG: imidazole glycerol phosphate synthase cyclase subunit [Actinomycetota bacterium]|nr:imidazole glycerol phosphate synthase cyclase subunit [Actinomycetota bacterium]